MRSYILFVKLEADILVQIPVVLYVTFSEESKLLLLKDQERKNGHDYVGPVVLAG